MCVTCVCTPKYLYPSVKWQAMEKMNDPEKAQEAFDTEVVPNVLVHFKAHNFTSYVSYAMTTGNWANPGTVMSSQGSNGRLTASANSPQSGGLVKSGVAQQLSTTNRLGVLSHLRRVCTPLEKAGRGAKPRNMHPLHLGFLCAAETPEGPMCGLVRAFSLGVRISTAISRTSYNSLLAFVVKWCEENTATVGKSWVWFNGEPLVDSSTGRPFAIHPSVLSDLRVKLLACCDVVTETPSFAWSDSKHLHILVDDGRALRPLQTTGGKVVYVSAQDICAAPLWCEPLPLDELHPVFMLGSTAAMIPFIQCNQSPRNAYQTSMGRQALSSGGCFVNHNSESTNLMYAQKPLCPAAHCNTKMAAIEQTDAPGQNFLVAICPHTGDNQNDSIVVNTHSIQRGIGMSMHILQLGKWGRYEVNHPYKMFQHEKVLGPLGVVLPGVQVEPAMVVLATRKETSSTSTDNNQDVQLYYTGAHDHGFVHKVVLVRGYEGFEINHGPPYIVNLSSGGQDVETIDDVQQWLALTGKDQIPLLVRIYAATAYEPRVGDKFASRHGQKGTAGSFVGQHEMPFTADGMVPDIVFNSHGIPSRMTMGQLWEEVISVLACIYGPDTVVRRDGMQSSSFGSLDHNLVADMLHENGIPHNGRHKMYSPITGEPLDTPVFLGFVYYQRLRHMVHDKFHARYTGPINQVTRQPSEGRSKDGGLRIGEMERDAIMAHGAIGLQRERFLWMSDAYQMTVCGKCGLPVSKDICSVCCAEKTDDNNFVHGVIPPKHSYTVPYSLKLMIQEMMAMGVCCQVDSSCPLTY